jgi:HKD family nuclease
MTIKFLGQGFEAASANAIGNYLISYLNQTNFHSFTGISAFASEAGIFGLSGHILNAKQNFQAPRNITLVVGVDQQGTSKEALEELKDLNVASYIFYQSEAPIFHPKIYLFEGDQQTKLIVGSSNLTGTGLFVNVEGSLLIEFDNNDPEGTNLLNELKSYYQTLFDLTDPNLFSISDAVIADFVVRGIVPDETTRRRNFNAKAGGSTLQSTGQQSSFNVPRRRTATIPHSFPRKPTVASSATPPAAATITPIVSVPQTPLTPPIQNRVLVWQKLSLSQSDAQRVPAGSNPTGNLKLSQAKFSVNSAFIDQTTYFRNIVFRNLTWITPKPNNNSYEEAFCPFDITILGNSIGVHTLKLSHDPVRIAGQGNTPTWLHWGNALIPLLQQNNINGKTLNLYTDGQNFSIEIV